MDSSSRAGFTQDVENGNNPHGRTVAWYGGTTNLSWSKGNPLGYPIHRRSGDFSIKELFDPNLRDTKPWYTPNHTGQPVGDLDAQWEGIGTGWYYSILGGGYYKRSLLPPTLSPRTPLNFDNTALPWMRGDFAVPTLFNGNFDGINQRLRTQPIPGWSLHNGDDEALQKYLFDWKDIPSLEQYRRDIGYDYGQPSYALRLSSGGLNEITHNPFIVPDWGVLRFNLHVPNPNGGTVTVSIKGTEPGDTWHPLTPIQLVRAQDPWVLDENGNLVPNPNRDRAVGYYDYINGNYIDPYTYTIGYGTNGFETFHLDIPDNLNLRGRSALLKFELEGDSTVYLDDVFLKSVHLKLGNPSFARPFEDTHRENYLIERPQYTLSYNDAIKGPNWVSWQLNKAWLGDLTRDEIEPETPPRGYNDRFPPGFGDGFPNYPNGVNPVDGTFSPVGQNSFPWLADQALPQNWVKTQGVDYLRNNRILNRRLDRGHMLPSSERARTFKDAYSTFLTTNALPQLSLINQLPGPWFSLEQAISRIVVNNSNVEYYIIAGGSGYNLNRVDPTPYPGGHPFENHPSPVPGVVKNFVARQQNPDTGEWEYSRDSQNRIRIDLRTDRNPEWTTNPKRIGVPDYTWKIIVPLRPGQGVADITGNTQVTAVIMPNVDPNGFPGGLIRLPNGRTLTINNPNDWTQYAVSVRDIEQITNYNFLSEVSPEIQDIIETRTNRQLFIPSASP